MATLTTRFIPTRVVATPGALAYCQAHGIAPRDLLARHCAGDWGALDATDRRENDRALRAFHAGTPAGRALASYPRDPACAGVGGDRLWIITDFLDDGFAITTLLLPEEY